MYICFLNVLVNESESWESVLKLPGWSLREDNLSDLLPQMGFCVSVVMVSSHMWKQNAFVTHDEQ